METSTFFQVKHVTIRDQTCDRPTAINNVSPEKSFIDKLRKPLILVGTFM